MGSLDSEFVPTHPTACAVYCSDGRFTRAVEGLVASLGHERLDVLALPGGPGLLTHTWGGKFFEVETVRNALRFLIEGHHLTALVLVAHAECGFYRARYPFRAPGELRGIQEQDLRAARTSLHGEHPRLGVHLAYASVVSNGAPASWPGVKGRIAFDVVDG